MMYLAEGDKIGIYASSDGKNWAYQGATVLNQYTLGGKDLGLVECPNLKTFMILPRIRRNMFSFWCKWLPIWFDDRNLLYGWSFRYSRKFLCQSKMQNVWIKAQTITVPTFIKKAIVSLRV